MKLNKRQEATVADLRAFADLMEQNPELIDVFWLTGPRKFYGFVHSGASDFARIALQLGESEKDADDNYYMVTAKIGNTITLELNTGRAEICERVVVDTEEIEVTERDESAVAEAIRHIPMVTKTVTRDIVEWVCPPSLHELAKDGVTA